MAYGPSIPKLIPTISALGTPEVDEMLKPEPGQRITAEDATSESRPVMAGSFAKSLSRDVSNWLELAGMRADLQSSLSGSSSKGWWRETLGDGDAGGYEHLVQAEEVLYTQAGLAPHIQKECMICNGQTALDLYNAA